MSKARHARPRRRLAGWLGRSPSPASGPASPPPAAGAAFATDYKVKAGDTLSEIAQANGADWHELARINNLKDPDLILIGQTLSLDGAKKATAPRGRSPRSEKKVVTKKTERKARTTRSEDRPATSVSMSAAWAKVAQVRVQR